MSRIEQILGFLQESPDDNFLVHALALEYIKSGEDAKARQYFEQNRNANPEYVATYYHLGKLLERLGDTDGAIEIYRLGMDAAEAAGDRHAYSELRSVHEELTF